MSSLITINNEIRDILMEQGAQDAVKCYQCGRCMAACPWNMLQPVNYAVYQFPQSVKLGTMTSSEKKEDIERETIDVFRCIGCDSCRYECPRGVNISDVLRAVRRILVDFGSYPTDLKSFITRLFNTGNPLGEPALKRIEWMNETGIPKFTVSHELLYFPCCIPSYDSRVKKVALATARILQTAGVSFGVIGEDEFCCGEAVRRAGAEKVFQLAVKRNSETFQKVKARNVLTTSPHCHTIFAKEYVRYYSGLKSTHATEFFSQLIKDKKIVPRKRFEKKVVYHDPCTLGRQMNVYDEPRHVLKSIPGLELMEVAVFNRKYSLCCGGGAMGLWREWSHDERLATVRLEQLMKTGADVIAVACPYCLQMFEETLKSMGKEVPVMDVAEILNESLG
ncbi:MAG TPA: (Fe-S)-binding protein [bacterium]